jgi:hypothetical protein
VVIEARINMSDREFQNLIKKQETAVATATAKPIPLDDTDLKIINLHSLLYSLVNIKG